MGVGEIVRTVDVFPDDDRVRRIAVLFTLITREGWRDVQLVKAGTVNLTWNDPHVVKRFH
jgi:hypothetical protein